MDYRWFRILSQPLFWALDKIHIVINHWGWSIVVLTLLIKLVFYKLTEAQFRSMGKLRKLQPRIQQLKERYGDDRQKFGQAMMEILQKGKGQSARRLSADPGPDPRFSSRCTGYCLNRWNCARPPFCGYLT